MKWSVVVALIATLDTGAWAQWDSLEYAPRDTAQVLYTADLDFREGIYFSFEEFRNNRPGVALKDLKDDKGRPVTDLRTQQGDLQYRDTSASEEAMGQVRLDRSIWGFCDRDIVHVNIGDGFFRIGMMGSIAHIVYDQTYSNRGGYYGGMYGMGPTNTTVQEQRLLDMGTGRFLPVTASGLLEVIQHDAELRSAFEALPKKERARDHTIFRFVRLYNERHPLHFPK